MSFKTDAEIVVERLAQYLKECKTRQKPVLKQRTIAEIQAELQLETHLLKGDLRGDNLDRFLHAYLDHTTRLHHPGFLAHQVGVPHPTGALAALVDGFTNNAMAIYEMGPGAATIEFFMINYLLEKIGWTAMPTQLKHRHSFPHGSGLLTHGGSLANLTALLTARNQCDPKVRTHGNPGDLVVLAPDSAHYSVVKASGIMGLGEQNVIRLPTDAVGRIDHRQLEPIREQLARAKKRVIALVANGCSTGTGLYDPLDQIADFCNRHNIWLHIDSAHGGCALFSKRHRFRLNGIQRADSLILDAHKMLRTPTLCAALLTKKAEPLDLVFESEASYLFHEKQQPGYDFIRQAVECTKAGLGLRLYCSLAAMGEKGLEAYIDQAFEMAEQAYEHLRAQPNFECPYRPESNILCFRISGSDQLQLSIRDTLIEQGHHYITSTQLLGRRYLRIVCISPHTERADIETLISGINSITAKLKDTVR